MSIPVTVKKMNEGVKLGSGTAHNIVIKPRTTTALKIEDVLFNLNSAILLPTNPEDQSSIKKSSNYTGLQMTQEIQSAQNLITGIGVIYSIYKFLEAYPEKKIIIAGHTDSSGEINSNFQLSELRGKGVLYLLLGQKEQWCDNSVQKHKIRDVQQILKHIRKVLYWPCDPGPIDNILGQKTQNAVESFQQNYNDSSNDLGLSGSSVIPIKKISNKVLNKKTWGAFYDIYLWQLAGMLNCNPDDSGFKPWRSRIKFIDENCKVLSCGESFPLEGPENDNQNSQTNRRVEILFFDPEDAPTFDCLTARDTIYTKMECPIYNPARFKCNYIDPEQSYLVSIELQTITPLGHRVGNINLILRHKKGTTDDIEVKTDEQGYWEGHHVPSGIYDILLSDGTPAKFNNEQNAVLDTAIGKSGLTSVIVAQEITQKDIEKYRLYQKLYKRTKTNTDNELEGRGGPARTTRRSVYFATDNLFLAAIDEKKQLLNETRLLKYLGEWIEDYFPEIHRHGYAISIHEGSQKYKMYTSKHNLQGEFSLSEKVFGHVGAYTPINTGHKIAFFKDMQSQSYGIALMKEDQDSGNIEQIEKQFEIKDIINEMEIERYKKILIRNSGLREVSYITLPKYGWLGVAYYGGTNQLENYSKDDTINKHVHTRNSSVVKTMSLAFESFLAHYIKEVEKAKSAEEIHALGPPPKPFTTPPPVGISDDQYGELLDIKGNLSNYSAWKVISDKLNALAGRMSAGQFFFRAKFTLKKKAEYGSGMSSYGEVKVEWNFDVSSEGVFTKREETLEVGLKGEGSSGKRKIGLTTKAEFSLKTGELNKTAVEGEFGPFGIELADDGDFKFKLGKKYADIITSGNVYTGSFGMGASVSTDSLLKEIKSKELREQLQKILPAFDLYLGIGFSGVGYDNILAYTSNAPGFFERRTLGQLLSPGLQWNDLDFDEQSHLTTLGWTMQDWDIKHMIPYKEFPVSTKANPYKLSAAEQIAIVHLGFHLDQWKPAWEKVAGEN